jgi:hypothetical protein
MKNFISTIFLFLFYSYAFAWDRFEIVDDFSGKKSFGYLQKSSNSSGGYLIISCGKNIKIEWDTVGNHGNVLLKKSEAPRAGAATQNQPKVFIKVDEDKTYDDAWSASPLDSDILIANDVELTLNLIGDKNDLRIKDEANNRVGAFKLIGLNKVLSKLQKSCR